MSIVLKKDVTQMIKNDGIVEFVEFKNSHLTYRVYNPVTDAWYQYDISVEETKGGTFPAKEKVMYHGRWIRKAINTNTFRKEF